MGVVVPVLVRVKVGEDVNEGVGVKLLVFTAVKVEVGLFVGVEVAVDTVMTALFRGAPVNKTGRPKVPSNPVRLVLAAIAA